MTETITENTIMTVSVDIKGEMRTLFVQKELPPAWIYNDCLYLFGSYATDGVYTYGFNIYSQTAIPDHTIAHELVHVKQQLEIGKDEWWKKYLNDRRFRMSQEVEAFRAQYECFKRTVKDRNQLDKSLRWLAENLAKGYKLEINAVQAAALIKNK